MRNAILIHGWNTKEEYYDPDKPTASNDHWFPWLTKQLMLQNIDTIAIEMPKGYYPEYAVWERELNRYDISEETVLIGHSCGSGFLIRWLSENPDIKVGKVFLVAPWLGIRFNDEPFDETFFDFEPIRTIAGQTDGLYVFSSADDFSVVTESVDIIRKTIDDVIYREFDDKGHFTRTSLGTEAFPELLKEIIS